MAIIHITYNTYYILCQKLGVSNEPFEPTVVPHKSWQEVKVPDIVGIIEADLKLFVTPISTITFFLTF